MEKNDLYLTLDRNITLIENCDNKTSIILSGIGIIIGILLATDYSDKIYRVIDNMTSRGILVSLLFLVATAVSICSIVLGIAYLFLVLLAKTSTNEYVKFGVETDSVLFFSSIVSNKSLKIYEGKVNNIDDTRLRHDLVSQVFICSLICKRKFLHYKRGLAFSVIGFTLFALTMVIGLIVTK